MKDCYKNSPQKSREEIDAFRLELDRIEKIVDDRSDQVYEIVKGLKADDAIDILSRVRAEIENQQSVVVIH